MDEDLTGRTGDLLAGLAMFRDASVPSPSPELASLFAATASANPSALPTSRRAPVYKRILAGIPSKIAAGALGALLAGSVGAGALTGTMVLTSNEDDATAVEVPEVDDGAVVADEHEDEVAVDEVDDDGANDAAADADLAAVPVPTSVSEAAQTHEFDEACGNHGHYVSHFAQTGTEPDCAVQARAAAAAAAAGAEVPVDQASADAVAEDVSKHEAKDEAKDEQRSARAESKAAKSAARASSESNKGKGGR